MIKYLQRRYALSHKGAVDNIKGILSCALQNISFMLPVGLLYLLVGEIMNVCAEESVLDSEGKIDVEKLAPITFDPVHNVYRKLGEVVGQAFQDGAKLK